MNVLAAGESAVYVAPVILMLLIYTAMMRPDSATSQHRAILRRESKKHQSAPVTA